MYLVKTTKLRLGFGLFSIAFLAFGLIGGCFEEGNSGNLPPPVNEGCCVIAEGDCEDGQTEEQCDALGGDLEIGEACSDIPLCQDPFETADLVRGGLLYDRWWVVIDAPEPEGTNSTYPAEENAMFQDPPRSGSQTYRCKECHGWDYLGVDGFYGPPSTHFTNVEGLLHISEGNVQTRQDHESPQELFEIIKFGIPGEMLPWGDFMSDDDIWDLVKFILEGLTDDRLLVDYSSPDMNVPIPPVDLENGADIFTDVCAVCHGFDGEGLEEFGTEGISLNEIALDNPVEFIHKVRFGQPGTDMPSLIDLAYNTNDVKDLLAYVQEVLPNPPVVDVGCCVIMEGDCEDGQSMDQCDSLGGVLEIGEICSDIDTCGGGPVIDGGELYQTECSACHGVDAMGDIAPNIVGASAEQINNAIMTVPLMASLNFLTVEEIDAIADYLATLAE
jgi:mono/diheme cytochrome c family protein